VTLSLEMAQHPVVRVLRSWNPGAVSAASEFRGELTVVTPAGLIRETVEFLRSHSELSFDFLADLTAVDRYPLEPRFEVVYHLRSMKSGRRLRLKALLPGHEPRIESLVGLWPAADMLEREVFDLFGVRFLNHPNLRRLMMPDDWEGHPLRKDYPMEGPH
jgi:NADH-quinone oxidoreductase subunit C